MRVLFIDPPGWQKHGANLGLAYLAGSLRREHIETKTLDLNNNNYLPSRIEEIVKEFSPVIIGISVKTATANSAKNLAGFLKKCFPEILIAVGGPHISICGEQFLNEEKSIDLGFVYEGEVSFTEFCKGLKKGDNNKNKIKNVIYRENGVLVIDKQPPGDPGFDKYALPYFGSILDFNYIDFRYPLLTSRGCPYECIFCCVSNVSGKRWRQRLPEDIVNELIEAKSRYQINSFEIMDDNFTFDINRAKTICRTLINRKLNLNWWCHNGIRADRIDRELAFLMKKAGCKSIAIGIETGNEELFNSINKKEKLKDIIKAVNVIKGAGIDCVGYFIIGLPGDSIEKTKETVRFQRKLRFSDYKYNLLVPYPGTKAWDIIKESGKLLLDITATSHFGDHSKVSFEFGKLNVKTMEICRSLTQRQSWWTYGEKDLKNINQLFKLRYGSDVKSILYLGKRDCQGVSKLIGLEFDKAVAIEGVLTKFEASQGTYELNCGESRYDYFASLYKLMSDNHRLDIDYSNGKIFLEEYVPAREEYICNEILAHPKDWDKPQGKFFATNLKFPSLTVASAKNGIVYKDGQPLFFSPVPEWEKVACGKIESGLAFISLAAYDQNSRYSASYLSPRTDNKVAEIKEAKITYETGSLLEKIMAQTDILFVPEYLSGFALIFSRAKINVIYHNQKQEEFSPRYLMLEKFNFYYKARLKLKNKCVFLFKEVQSTVNYFFININKIYGVFLIWFKILGIFSLAKVRYLVLGQKVK